MPTSIFLILGTLRLHFNQKFACNTNVHTGHYILTYWPRLDHVYMLCSTANYKLHALRRIRKHLTLEKVKLLYNTFINSQFNYASVIWMFCRKKDYLKIEKIQYKESIKKALKIIYSSNESYDELLTRSNDVSIHQKHLRALATEIYKGLADLSRYPDFMKPYLKRKKYHIIYKKDVP